MAEAHDRGCGARGRSGATATRGSASRASRQGNGRASAAACIAPEHDPGAERLGRRSGATSLLRSRRGVQHKTAARAPRLKPARAGDIRYAAFRSPRRCLRAWKLRGAPRLDLRYSESDEEFRRELRAWLADAVPKHGAPPPTHDWPARRALRHRLAAQALRRRLRGHQLAEASTAGATPRPPSSSSTTRRSRARDAPYVGVNFVGLLHGGPTLIAEGTPEQKATHLPRILRGEEVWCQGFSEPGAGSDLAALATRAVRDGDDYVVNGHKIWSSFAQVADYCELLVRTDPERAEAPRHHLADPADGPAGHRGPPAPDARRRGRVQRGLPQRRARARRRTRVGAENDGWRVTNVTLRFERGTAFASEMIKLQQRARRPGRGSRSASRATTRAPGTTRRCAARSATCAAELDALWAMVKLSVSEAAQTRRARASRARRSSSTTRSSTSASPSSACACSAAPRSRARTSRASRASRSLHTAPAIALAHDRRRHRRRSSATSSPSASSACPKER